MARATWLALVGSLSLALGASACASGGDKPASADGGGNKADAAVPRDGGGELGGRPAAETVSGSGRLRGGSFTLDVQVGHPVAQQPASAGARQLEGAAVVKP